MDAHLCEYYIIWQMWELQRNVVNNVGPSLVRRRDARADDDAAASLSELRRNRGWRYETN